MPLIPYFLGHQKEGIVIAAVIAGAALFCVGTALSLFSGRNGLFGGACMLLIGSIARRPPMESARSLALASAEP